MKHAEEELRARILMALSETSDGINKAIHRALIEQAVPKFALDSAIRLHAKLIESQLSAQAENAEILSKNVEFLALSMEQAMKPLAAEGKPGYDSGTFRCKSDCDLCLDHAETALDKALCYALFARCIAKG